MQVYKNVDSLDFELADCPAVPQPRRVLMTTPDFFDVEYVINPHMKDHVGSVDSARAQSQWQELRAAYEDIGIATTEVGGVDSLPDMVFCANQTLPYYNPRSGEQGVVLSRMHAPQRRDEVEHYARYFGEIGYSRQLLPADVGHFEGMGDALWHPGRYLLWGGSGFRTTDDVYQYVAEKLNVRILALPLVDPDFYHLDTCLSLLDEKRALYYPGAFSDDGIALLEHFFDKLITAPEDEARRLFACNAHSPDGHHVFIQRGCTETVRRLRREGFTPVELDTDEFLKSGGSVFCMKQMYW